MQLCVCYKEVFLFGVPKSNDLSMANQSLANHRGCVQVQRGRANNSTSFVVNAQKITGVLWVIQKTSTGLRPNLQ